MANLELKTEFGSQQTEIEAALAKMEADKIVARIWEHDHTVWKPEPTEITNRLGWLDIAERLKPEVPRLEALRNNLLQQGYTQALLLGMGGSSLAPEVFAKTFGGDHHGLELSVLDSTDPGAVQSATQHCEPGKTVYIVSTKSGGTVETLSFFKYFYNQVLAAVGLETVGEHFIAITDPGSKLEALAQQYKFRETFINDPNIGGRFSVMSFFGLVPAALVGVDVGKLIERTEGMARACRTNVQISQNPGALTGLLIGLESQRGRDKLTFVTSPEIASFGDWVEQLIAESTGKEGKGILPVVGEALGSPEVYSGDRVFVHLRLGKDARQSAVLKALEAAGHPVMVLELPDRYDLGAQYFLWEFATAVAGHVLEIIPFNQPNVESAKVMARQMVAEYEQTGKLPKADYAPLSAEALTGFLGDPAPNAYLSLQAYVIPTPEAAATLTAIRLKLRDTYKVATTLGFGPRFLHSTGQLHKGDGGNGLFVQIISGAEADLPIPDEAGHDASAMSFQTLKESQALGDAAALEAAGRRVLRLKIESTSDLAKLGA